MRNLRYSRSSTMLEYQRRLSLNTVVLPPLSSALVEDGAEILGKLLVNKSKPPGVNADLVAVARTTDSAPIRSTDIQKCPESSRVAQLEQNIRFLQEQHQLMLNGLHHEIDSLRHRNRELQFQLVFAKTSLPSTPSTPEDETKPKVELLEREMSDLKIQLQEAESRNIYLSAIVDEQKKKLERYERERERERERGIQPDPELLRKLDDAEALIRRLRRENSDLRRENSASPNNYANNRDSAPYHGRDGGGPGHPGQKNSNQNRGGNGSRHRGSGGGGGGGGGGSGHYRNWFPPLHSQNYWQSIRNVEKNGGNGPIGDGSQLPNLQTGGGSVNGGNHQGRRGGNNNHYHSDGRKFRGGQNRANKPS